MPLRTTILEDALCLILNNGEGKSIEQCLLSSCRQDQTSYEIKAHFQGRYNFSERALMDAIILYVVAGLCLAASFFKDKGKTMLALKKAFKAFEGILPQFLIVLLLVAVRSQCLIPRLSHGCWERIQALWVSLPLRRSARLPWFPPSSPFRQQRLSSMTTRYR